jgi:hypothetical protein
MAEYQLNVAGLLVSLRNSQVANNYAVSPTPYVVLNNECYECCIGKDMVGSSHSLF